MTALYGVTDPLSNSLSLLILTVTALSARAPSALRRVRARRVRVRLRATLGEKFGDRRGADVPTVADAVGKFNEAFARPVPIVYRPIVNELITASHLAIVCAMWRYDALFAAGFEHVFDAYLAYYPNDDERARLRICVAQALGLDPAKLAADAAAVRAWALERTTADAVFAAVADEAAAADSSPAVEALRAVKNVSRYEFYYSRCYGIGLITVMQAVGVELNVPNAEMWADRLGLEKSKFSAEMGVYLSSMERLKQAEQIFAEAAAREARKTADRLARRAEAAAKKLEELEKNAPDAAPAATDSGSTDTEANPLSSTAEGEAVPATVTSKGDDTSTKA